MDTLRTTLQRRRTNKPSWTLSALFPLHMINDFPTPSRTLSLLLVAFPGPGSLHSFQPFSQSLLRLQTLLHFSCLGSDPFFSFKVDIKGSISISNCLHASIWWGKSDSDLSRSILHNRVIPHLKTRTQTSRKALQHTLYF